MNEGPMTFSASRLLGYSLGSAGCVVGMVNTTRRLFDTVEGTDPFAVHTAEQQRKHPFSGMHEPFIPTQKQQDLFLKHFPQYSHLLPTSLEEIRRERALETSVKIHSLASCPVKHFEQKGGIVVGGGPPALLSSANLENVTYICNLDGSSIHDGSAFHVEPDAPSETRTDYLPTHFTARQVLRLFNYESLRSAEKTGHFSWRTLDWVGWLKHPGHWAEGARIALAFERTTRKASGDRASVLNEMALRCRANQLFFKNLNEALDGQLLLPGRGSIIVARTEEEKQSLEAMDQGLKEEGRSLRFLSKSEIQSRYGFVPQGIAFAEKEHDAVLSPNFKNLIAKRLEMLGGKIINGSLTTIYVDNPGEEGIIEYTTPNGKREYAPFSRLVLSLGTQRIFGQDDKPLFDIVSARGVSALAFVYLPKGMELPPAIVCGGTNHVIKLSEAASIEVDGQRSDVYLVRMTAAACITPNVLEENAADYDGTAAIGLASAVRKTLGCRVEILAVYGCNRQMSAKGQSHWITVPSNGKTTSPFSLKPREHDLDLGTYLPPDFKGVAIQFGAGGGGLTQGPAQGPIQTWS